MGCDPAHTDHNHNQQRFQSTHPSGVRRTRPRTICCWSHFNPRTPVGCDAGARTIRPPRCHFNPRTPVGCDLKTLILPRNADVFQSTHPSGVRHPIKIRNPLAPNFNPRTPVGCDPSTKSTVIPPMHFNPRTPVGCDFCRPFRARPHPYFNPRTPVGCDVRFVYPQSNLAHFNPRTPVGCDYYALTGKPWW